MRFSILLPVWATLGAFVSAALASPPPTTHGLHERREIASQFWVREREADGEMIVPVRIGLKQSNLAAGHDLLMDLAHPESPNHRNWRTPEEIIDMFKPLQSTVDVAKSWLLSEDISENLISLSANKQWIQVNLPLKKFESVLHAKFHIYKHKITGESSIFCEEYHIPTGVQEHIDYVTPGIHPFKFGPSKKTHRKRPTNSTGDLRHTTSLKARSPDSAMASCYDTDVTNPDCVRRFYNIPEGDKANPINMMGLYESGGTYSQADMDYYFNKYIPKIPSGKIPQLEREPIGGIDPDLIGAEADADTQVAISILYPQNIIVYQQVGHSDWLTTMDGSYCGECERDIAPNVIYIEPPCAECGIYRPPKVISISYSSDEDELPINIKDRICREYMKLGLQGTTTVVSASDLGVGQLNREVFSPRFPASCPYVTAVGATVIRGGTEVAFQEWGWMDSNSEYSTGGGFSNRFPQPEYQKSAVDTYFREHNPSYKYYSMIAGSKTGSEDGKYNRAGRGYPDLSAVGHVPMILEGKRMNFAGTSASAPIVAAMFNRINEELIALNKPTIGFANPVLYANRQIFKDITSGNNPGANTPGFSAVKGWDPVSGLGTPDYMVMLEVWKALDWKATGAAKETKTYVATSVQPGSPIGTELADSSSLSSATSSTRSSSSVTSTSTSLTSTSSTSTSSTSTTPTSTTPTSTTPTSTTPTPTPTPTPTSTTPTPTPTPTTPTPTPTSTTPTSTTPTSTSPTSTTTKTSVKSSTPAPITPTSTSTHSTSNHSPTSAFVTTTAKPSIHVTFATYPIPTSVFTTSTSLTGESSVTRTSETSTSSTDVNVAGISGSGSGISVSKTAKPTSGGNSGFGGYNIAPVAVVLVYVGFLVV